MLARVLQRWHSTSSQQYPFFVFCHRVPLRIRSATGAQRFHLGLRTLGCEVPLRGRKAVIMVRMQHRQIINASHPNRTDSRINLWCLDASASGGYGVAEYRAYVVGQDGHFIRREPLICADDAEAIAKAKRLVVDYDVELWSGKRFVIRLEVTTK
jgi:hypothetical protein